MRINQSIIRWAVLCSLAALPLQITAASLGTAFSYQGRLSDANGPVTGLYDFTFTLWDASTLGNQLGTTFINSATALGVTNGLFTTSLDFGPCILSDQVCWLEITVCTNLDEAHKHTLPRQQLMPAPQSLYAPTAGTANTVAPNAVTAASIQDATITAGKMASGQVVKSLNGLTDAVTLTAGANVTLAATGNNTLQISTAGGGGGGGWSLTGNASTAPPANFLGTLDPQPLEFHVNGTRALRLEPTANDAVHSNILNVLGGSPENTIANGVCGATIAGGGATIYWNHGPVPSPGNSVESDFGTVGGGFWNRIESDSSDGSTISGGGHNTIGTNAYYSTIAGGGDNRIHFFARHSSIGGGGYNEILEGAGGSFVGGGWGNSIQTNARNSALVGGVANSIQPNAYCSFLGGGQNNSIQPYVSMSFLGGGFGNSIAPGGHHSFLGSGLNNTNYGGGFSVIGGGEANQISADWATIGGGAGNRIQPNTPFATIPGGQKAQGVNYGQLAYASGGFNGQEGTAQASLYVLRNTTTDATPRELFLDGINTRLSIPKGSTWVFEALVVARTQDSGDFGQAKSAGFRIRGVIRNAGGATVLHGASGEALYQDDASWSARANGDDAHDALTFTVQGGATPMRWVATVRTAEVMFPQ